MPPMQIEVLEYADPHAPYGVRGVGEPPTISSGPGGRRGDPAGDRPAAAPGADPPGAHHRHVMPAPDDELAAELEAPSGRRRVDLVVRARRAVLDGGRREVAVVVDGGRIVALAPFDAEVVARRELVLADDEVLLPGLVDTHVHVNEPGRTEWEGFATATRAAAAGGVTTLVDMPLNSMPPTVDLPALRPSGRRPPGSATSTSASGAAPSRATSARLPALHDGGRRSGSRLPGRLRRRRVPAARRRPAGRRALTELATFDGLLIVHAEDPAVLAAAHRPPVGATPDFLGSRPAPAEDAAIAHG